MKNEQQILNMVYDLVSQNPIPAIYDLDHQQLTDMVDHVDLENNTIYFIR